MRIAYFDCFSGIAGDMVVGALLDAGLKLTQLEQELSRLGLAGYRLTAKKAKRGNLTGTDFKVQVSEEGHKHRHYKEIRRMIGSSLLAPATKEMSLGIFDLLAQAEAKVHNQPVDEVVLHEIGAVDSIVDVVGAGIGLNLLEVDAVYASEIPLGQGTISCIHGHLPSPAPATLEILKGVPVYSSGRKAELVTPTGAAILKYLATSFGPLPPLTIERVGYGAGDDDFADMPNLLRVILGESTELYERDTILVLETNIDDMSPQAYEGLMESLFAAGALDVALIPQQMKKNRPGICLKILGQEKDKEQIVKAVLTETTALGMRFYRASRFKLKRQDVILETRYGKVRAKAAQRPNGSLSVMPEYDDCKRLAAELGLSFREVYSEAMRRCLSYGQEPRERSCSDIAGSTLSRTE